MAMGGTGQDWPGGTAPIGDWWRSFQAAWQFFSRVPLPLPDSGRSAIPLGQAAIAFAPVGALLGLAIGLAFVLGKALGLPNLLAALAAVAIGIVLTGALHEDGLADCADALGGRGERARKLEIMREAHNGSYAGLALIFSVGLRAAALASLGNGAAIAACIGAHALSRGFLAGVMAHQPLARSDGLAAAAGAPGESAARSAIVIGLILVLAPGVFFSVGGALLATLLGLAAMAGATGLARRAFGGYTGDVLGAIQQCGETAMLVGWAMAIGNR